MGPGPRSQRRRALGQLRAAPGGHPGAAARPPAAQPERLAKLKEQGGPARRRVRAGPQGHREDLNPGGRLSLRKEHGGSTIRPLGSSLVRCFNRGSGGFPAHDSSARNASASLDVANTSPFANRYSRTGGRRHACPSIKAATAPARTPAAEATAHGQQGPRDRARRRDCSQREGVVQLVDERREGTRGLGVRWPQPGLLSRRPGHRPRHCNATIWIVRASPAPRSPSSRCERRTGAV